MSYALNPMAQPASPLALDLDLPWSQDQRQEERFKKGLKRALIPLLLLFFLVPFLPVYEPEFEQNESDIVKTEIILDPLEIEPEPTPEPVAPVPVPTPVPEPAVPKQEVVEVQPTENRPPAPEPKERDIAQEQGLTAISSQLSSLRQSLDLSKLQRKNVSTSEGGTIARAESTVLGEDQLTLKSEGIEVDESMMRDENIALLVHESTKLDGFIEDTSPDVSSSNFYSDLRGRRSDESIRRVFEAGKNKAYFYYLRKLRDVPGLSGTFVFEAVIEPNGDISHLQLVSSELESPDLESLILNSVQQLNFGEEDVSPRKLTYTYNFLPS